MGRLEVNDSRALKLRAYTRVSGPCRVQARVFWLGEVQGAERGDRVPSVRNCQCLRVVLPTPPPQNPTHRVHKSSLAALSVYKSSISLPAGPLKAVLRLR